MLFLAAVLVGGFVNLSIWATFKSAFVACRLIPLSKYPRLRPIGDAEDLDSDLLVMLKS